MAILGLLNIFIFLFCGFQASGNEKLPQEFFAMRSALCDKPSDFTEIGCKVCPKFMAEGSQGLLNEGLGINSILLGVLPPPAKLRHS